MKAYPYLHKHPTSGETTISEGMDLRDYIAAKAMQGQVNSPLKLGDDEAHRLIAERSYRMADAMMKARNKQEVSE